MVHLSRWVNQHQYIIYNGSPHFAPISLVFTYCPFSDLRSHPGQHLHLHRPLLDGQYLTQPLHWMTPGFWRALTRYCEDSLRGDRQDVFPMIAGVVDLGGWPVRSSATHHLVSVSSYHTVNMASLILRFLLCTVVLFPHFYTVPSGRKSLCSFHLKGESCVPLLRGQSAEIFHFCQIYPKYFVFLMLL